MNKRVHTCKYYRVLEETWPTLRWVHEDDHVIAFERGGLVFAFNFSPTNEYRDYTIPVSRGVDYRILFSSDDWRYGGYGRVAREPVSAFLPGHEGNCLRLYLPPRTATVLCPADM